MNLARIIHLKVIMMFEISIKPIHSIELNAIPQQIVKFIIRVKPKNDYFVF